MNNNENQQKYDREAIGDIIFVKGLIFKNHSNSKQELDHAWKDGRPCIIIYSDDEYDYIMTMTSVDKSQSLFKDEYFKLNSQNILYLENYRYRLKYKKSNRKESFVKEPIVYKDGFINLKNIYKIPISSHDKLGKVTFQTYKDVSNALKMQHQSKNIKEILNSAVSVRR